MTKHTKGEWYIVKHKNDPYYVAGPNSFICKLMDGKQKSNADLIAAAPELMKTLETIISISDCMCGGPIKSGTCTICRAYKTIAKAKGK